VGTAAFRAKGGESILQILYMIIGSTASGRRHELLFTRYKIVSVVSPYSCISCMVRLDDRVVVQAKLDTEF